MVKRKRVTKTKRRTTKRGFSGMFATAAGVGGYLLFESMVEPKLIQMANITNPMIVNVVELAAAAYVARRPGVLGQVGKAAIVVNLYQLLHPYLSTIGTPANGGAGFFS